MRHTHTHAHTHTCRVFVTKSRAETKLWAWLLLVCECIKHSIGIGETFCFPQVISRFRGPLARQERPHRQMWRCRFSPNFPSLCWCADVDLTHVTAQLKCSRQSDLPKSTILHHCYAEWLCSFPELDWPRCSEVGLVGQDCFWKPPLWLCFCKSNGL